MVGVPGRSCLITSRSMRAVVLALLAACSSTSHPSRPDAAAPSDAPCPPDDTVYSPITVSGTSPFGSLDDTYHYAVAGHLSGFCIDSYRIDVTPTRQSPTCNQDPWLELVILTPQDAANPYGAAANLVRDADGNTTMVEFQATQLDPPDAQSPRIAGHFISTDPAWTFDIAVDLTSQYNDGCI